jgi:hypothetical protein
VHPALAGPSFAKFLIAADVRAFKTTGYEVEWQAGGGFNGRAVLDKFRSQFAYVRISGAGCLRLVPRRYFPARVKHYFITAKRVRRGSFGNLRK